MLEKMTKEQAEATDKFLFDLIDFCKGVESGLAVAAMLWLSISLFHDMNEKELFLEYVESLWKEVEVKKKFFGKCCDMRKKNEE